MSDTIRPDAVQRTRRYRVLRRCALLICAVLLAGPARAQTALIGIGTVTTTAVSSTANPSVFGQTVTFTATVTPIGGGTPTGNLTFTVDGVLFASVMLAQGKAQLIVNSLSVSGAPHAIVATYGGDDSFLSSVGSLAGGQTVFKASTTTALVSSQNPSVHGQAVTFTATVTVNAPGAGSLTGTLVFTIDGISQAPISLLAGSASFTTASLSQASHSVTAAYLGNASYNASTSAILTQVVELPPFGAPAAFSATATSPSQVVLSWEGVSAATGYEVFRSSQNGPYSLALSTAGTSANDNGLAPDTAYLYKVRALGSGGPSAFSAVDVATTTVFTDPNLAGALVKGTHLLEVRTAVSAVRVAAGLPPVSFADPAITLGVTPIGAIHLTELRSALDAARAAIGLAPIVYADTITPGSTTVKAQHVLEIRSGVQ